MRIACPACNAAYQVPNEQLSQGRIVRCVRCGTDWAPLEAVPAPDENTERDKVAPMPVAVVPQPIVEAPEVAFEPRRKVIEEEIPIPVPLALPKPPPATRGSVLLVIAWIVSLAVVGGALIGLYVGRERVMLWWPPSIRAYAPLGLAGPPATLERRE